MVRVLGEHPSHEVESRKRNMSDESCERKEGTGSGEDTQPKSSLRILRFFGESGIVNIVWSLSWKTSEGEHQAGCELSHRRTEGIQRGACSR